MPVEKQDRLVLRRVTGSDVIPTLILEDASPVVGETEIRTWLDAHVVEPAEAGAHNQKAARARRRQLEEDCECLQPATP